MVNFSESQNRELILWVLHVSKVGGLNLMAANSTLSKDSRKTSILVKLYKYRGITIEQLYYSLHPQQLESNFASTEGAIQPSIRTPLKTLRKHMNDLEEIGLIEHVNHGRRTKFYYLTKEGLEFTKNVLDIPVEYIGSGFNDDYGDFEYEKYKPPLSRLVHHLLLTDFFLHCERVTSITPDVDLNYRDNRYAHVQYVVKKNELINDTKEANAHFRPDAEIIIDGKRYYIEIDTASERSDHLRKKFEGYARFFSSTGDESRSLPNGIIFVSEARQRGDYGQRRRWQTLSNAFHEQLFEYSHLINLKSCSVTDVEQILLSETDTQKNARFLMFKNLIKYYFIDGNYNGTQMLSVDTSRGWMYGNAYFNYNQDPDYPHIYLYLDCCGLDSKPAILIREFKKWLDNQNESIEILKAAKEIVPVFTYTFGTPYTHHLNEVNHELSNALWMDISSDSPVWYNSKGEKLQVRNPILYRLEQIKGAQ